MLACRQKSSLADLVRAQLLHNLKFGSVQVWSALQAQHLAQHMPEGLNAEPLLVLDGIPVIYMPVELACAYIQLRCLRLF